MGSVVDQQIERPQRALRFGYEPGAGIVRGDVGDQRQPAHLARHGLRRLGIAIDYRDRGTLPGQPQRGGATDAATTAGDQGDVAIEPHGTPHAASASRTRSNTGSRQCP